MAVVNFPVGLTPVEITTPARANGARITLQRAAWPPGALFTWTLYERERDGQLLKLASATEFGGPAPNRDGTPGDGPLVITLRWPADRDKDRIRVEVNALQAFTSDITAEWL